MLVSNTEWNEVERTSRFGLDTPACLLLFVTCSYSHTCMALRYSHYLNYTMGKEKKRRRVYVHEPEAPSFIATKATGSCLHRAFINAPPPAAITEEASLPLSNTFEFALGIPNDSNGNDQQEVTVINENTPTDASGLIVRTRAKRYTNSVRMLYNYIGIC